MISSRLAEGMLVLFGLASLAGAAVQSPLKPGDEGAMFVDQVVLEQPMSAPQAADDEGAARNPVTPSSVAAEQ